MGFKVNLFITSVASYGIAFLNLPCFLLTLTLIGFCLAYSYWKNWKYLAKVPGGKSISVRGFFENSYENFYETLLKLWKQHGRDKFVVWIGFERAVVLSKFHDVKVRENFAGTKYFCGKFWSNFGEFLEQIFQIFGLKFQFFGKFLKFFGKFFKFLG